MIGGEGSDRRAKPRISAKSAAFQGNSPRSKNRPTILAASCRYWVGSRQALKCENAFADAAARTRWNRDNIRLVVAGMVWLPAPKCRGGARSAYLIELLRRGCLSLREAPADKASAMEFFTPLPPDAASGLGMALVLP